MTGLVKRETVKTGWGWMTTSDWTDFTIQRLMWKLDEDKKHKFLEPWQRNVAWSIWREAKASGPDYKLVGDRRRQARDILSITRHEEALVE